jgi:predicted Rossmann fold nucleotide-binding protein DprA/Smf involved in DNA uptake
MSSEGLVELARRYVACSDELESLRDQIKLAVMNGGEPAANPTSAPRRGQPTSSHPNAKASKAVEAQILELLRTKPMKAAEIAAATSAKLVTTHDRLRRLRQRGLAAPVDGAWAATA